MCLCTPEIRTPFCGKVGCEWPRQEPPLRTRLQLIYVTPELVAGLWSGKYEVIANGLPKDFKIVGRGYSEKKDCFYCIVQSAEFQPIPEGGEIPEREAARIRRLD